MLKTKNLHRLAEFKFETKDGIIAMQRIEQHPILSIAEAAEFTFTCDGKEVTAREGETVAAALIANGIRTFRHTAKHHEPRGSFCGIGQCTDCIMEIDGVRNVRACMTMAKPGMVVRSQDGHGKIAGEGKDAE